MDVQIDKRCRQGLKIQICNSPAGYYFGTYDKDGPRCRISGYFKKEPNISQLYDKERLCEENMFCHKGKGCGIK